MPEAIYKLFVEIQNLKCLMLEANSNEQIDKLLSIIETAEFLHIKKQTIYTYVSKGIIPHSKRAGKLYFSKKDLIEWVKEGNKRSFDVEEAAKNVILKRKMKGGSHE